MQAMIITGFGGPEVFKQAEVEMPAPGPNELLVKVVATSVNPVDYKVRQAGSWTGLKMPAIIGWDVSGVVEEAGSEVGDFKPGDEVYYSPSILGGPGTYAEYHVVPASLAATKPANISHEQAAGIPLAGETAWDALITRGRLQVGETVLIHGGSGGVGSLAVQIAKAAGAYVFTTSGKYNFDFVHSLGADRIIDYRSEDFVEIIQRETAGQGVNLVFDTVGGEMAERDIQAAAIGGRIITIAGASGNFGPAQQKNLDFHSLSMQRARYKLDYLSKLIQRGQLKPVVDSIMPLGEVSEAHRKLEAGGVKGKIILSIADWK